MKHFFTALCFRLCSFSVALVLMLLYAAVCAVATFIENDYGTPTAKALIYGAWWFDLLHALLALSLIGIFVRFRVWRGKNYASLLFHSALIVIVLGAGITRYFGFEGVLHIREGSESHTIITQEEYLQLEVEEQGRAQSLRIPVVFSALTQSQFSKNLRLENGDLAVEFVRYTPASEPMNPPTLEIKLRYKGQEQPLTLTQSFLPTSRPQILTLGDVHISATWGPLEVQLPFALYLDGFVLERYAGSMSPSSYASEIIIKDSRYGLSKPFRIFMNNVLDYDGYRFFQSSYDEDEQGTILSVNKDPGKLPTYIGYAMLTIGLIWSFFYRGGRFSKLQSYLKAQKLFALALVCAATLTLPEAAHAYESRISPHGGERAPIPDSHALDSQSPQNQDSNNPHGDQAFFDESIPEHTSHSSVVTPNPTPEDIRLLVKNIREKMGEHSKLLGHLMIEDFGGRMKPLDTHAADLVHKITGKDGFLGMNNNEIFLGMLMYPYAFQKIKMFAVKTPKLREILGTPPDEKYVAFDDFFSEGSFKLANYIEEANRKKPAQRDELDKDILNASERLNVAFIIYTAQALVIFPDLTHQSKGWLSPSDAVVRFSREDSLKIQTLLQNYFSSVDDALSSNQWGEADSNLRALLAFQASHASEAMPPQSRIDMELWLNHYNPFYSLIFAYLLIGVVLCVAVLVSIVRNASLPRAFTRAMYALSALCVVAHTLALAARWYVGDHAPWSNAYESMVYIAWAGAVGGVVFFRRSSLALSSATLLAGIALFVAHLGFMDPQIGNLVPVLKSYWLNIHVSVITASYGFLGLCFVLGVITLLLFILRSEARAHIDQSILNLHCLNEMSMILGLAFLSVGNFLGGVWANESWGRYWGWDSKETWALISIVVYAVILHARFIARLNTPYAFAVLSVVGFYSVLMTYFGVNYYLSGMHSYAAGDPVPVPSFLYILVAVNLALILLAWRKRPLPHAV